MKSTMKLVDDEKKNFTCCVSSQTTATSSSPARGKEEQFPEESKNEVCSTPPRSHYSPRNSCSSSSKDVLDASFPSWYYESPTERKNKNSRSRERQQQGEQDLQFLQEPPPLRPQRTSSVDLFSYGGGNARTDDKDLLVPSFCFSPTTNSARDWQPPAIQGQGSTTSTSTSTSRTRLVRRKISFLKPRKQQFQADIRDNFELMSLSQKCNF